MLGVFDGQGHPRADTALHHSEDGRCALVPCPVWALKAGSAVHKHDDVPRASQGFRERSRGVDVDQIECSLCPGRGAVRCRRADALGHRTPRAWSQLPYKLNTVLLGSGFQYTRMGVGKRNVEVVYIYYSFFIFVDEQSIRREHCRSHTIITTRNRRRLFSLLKFLVEVKVLLFLRQVWRFMLPSKVMPCFPVFEDNQGAVQLAQNPITNSNSKHIDVRHHFLRELVRQRDMKVVQVPSGFQHVDILTKALAFDLFANHRKFLMNLK